jgi:hypothetical protein
MITFYFIFLLFFGIAFEALAIFLFVYGIHAAITDKDVNFCVVMFISSLLLSSLSGIIFVGAHDEYQNGIPQNQVKILRQKISDAEKELQKYLIDHPDLKEETREEY